MGSAIGCLITPINVCHFIPVLQKFTAKSTTLRSQYARSQQITLYVLTISSLYVLESVQTNLVIAEDAHYLVWACIL